MLKYSFYFITFLLALGISSCKNDKAVENKKNAETVAPEPMVLPAEEKPDKERIVGIWSQPDKPFWLEFHADGTYSSGKGPEVKEENLEWRLNEETHILTLNSNKGIRNIQYRFEGMEVYFIREGKSKEKLFQKIPERPMDK